MRDLLIKYTKLKIQTNLAEKIQEQKDKWHVNFLWSF
jgi:hypothetical protein